MFLISCLQFYAAGDNGVWQLGLGLDPNVTKKVLNFQQNEISTKHQFKKISINKLGGLALDQNDQMYTWGFNSFGQRGETTERHIQIPTIHQYFVDHKVNISLISAGDQHSLVLAKDGRSLYSFGNNEQQLLGRATSGSKDSTPGLVDLSNLPEDEKIIQINANKFNSHLLTNNGNIYFWGKETQTSSVFNIPTIVNISEKAIIFYSNFKTLFFITKNLDVYSYGSNKNGQLCVGHSNYVNVPEKVDLNNVTKIVLSEQHTVILKDGIAYGCGTEVAGQLGNTTIIQINENPIIISEGCGNVSDVSATNFGTILLSQLGLFAAGRNQNGELSLKNTTYYKSFTQIDFVDELNNQTRIQSSYYYSIIYTEIQEIEEEIEEEAKKEEEVEKEKGEEEMEEEEQIIPPHPEEEEEIMPIHALTTGQIVGIVIGSIIGAVILGLSIFFIVKFIKNKSLSTKQRDLKTLYSTNPETQI